MKTVEFKFEPLEYVTIRLYGLNYEARVVRCIHSGRLQNIYDCDYAADGKLEHRGFYEDELITK